MMRRLASLSASFTILIVLSAIVVAGCSVANDMSLPVIRPAVDTPDHFVLGSLAEANAEPLRDAICRNPLVDPRDGTRIVLIRSSNGQGDYQVEAGRYGAGDGELLRVSCATGRPVGIARR